MYSQETINWESLKSSVDEMFPVRSPTVSKPNPAQMTDWETIERNARLRIPRRFQERRFCQEAIAWLGTPVDPSIADTASVMAVRVSQSLCGGTLNFVGSFSMEQIEDPQTFCNSRGLGLELRNTAGQAVGKFTPTVDYVSFL